MTPARRHALELEHLGLNDEIVVAGCRLAKTGGDISHHNHDAVTQHALKCQTRFSQELDASRLEVLDVDGVVDVTVGIQLIETDADRESVSHRQQATRTAPWNDASDPLRCTSMPLDEVGLAPRLVDDDGGRVREIEGSTTPSDWDAKAVGHGDVAQDDGGQTVRLTAEQQGVAVAVRDVRVEPLCMLRVGEESQRPGRVEEALEVVVNRDLGMFAVVQAGPPEPRIIEFEPERANKMQAVTGIHAQPHEVAGIRRDLGPVKDNMEHRVKVTGSSHGT